MIGPSSSHTAGAARLANLARRLLQGPPRRARFTLYGSLASTYRGHGTDLALTAGSLGLAPDDERLRHAASLAKEAELAVEIVSEPRPEGLIHPNLVRIELFNAQDAVNVMGASLGGGKVEIYELDGFPVRLLGDEYTLVIHSQDRVGVLTSVTNLISEADANIGNMAVSRMRRGKSVIMCIELDAPLPECALEKLRAQPDIKKLTVVEGLRGGVG